jgi:uncharacterized protein YjdB
MRKSFKKIRGYLLISLMLSTFAVGLTFVSEKRTDAVSREGWNAGKIISDTQFYNNNSMSISDIQNFLNSRVSNCDTNGTQSAADKGYPNLNHAQYATQVRGWSGPPYVCLKDYMQVPDSTQIISNFQGSTPSGAISAAQIIKNAADTHGISPKVLLVMLQKESQNLLYDTWPMLSQYKNSMGYACPDTAPCDPQYAGFYNQMYNAARQFKLYRTNAPSYRYKPFQTNLISYQANAPSCGASNVYVENYATASLYNYTPYQPNEAALNNLYGSGDSCSAYGNRNFWRVYSDWFGSTEFEETLLSFNSHVSYVGWTNRTINYGVTGSIGQNKTIEAFRMAGDVEYSSYNDKTGWQPTVSNDMISGTTNQSTSIKAIKINPTGTFAARYDVYYRSHVSYIGWMGWVKNGTSSGAIGDTNQNIEAIEVLLVPKGLAAPGSSSNAFISRGALATKPTVNSSVTAHVGSIGWQPSVESGMVAGTTERDKPIEALKVTLNNATGVSGNVKYSTYLAYSGWQDIKANGEQAGTTGEGRPVEAFRATLTGDIANQYDIWYRGYVEYKGWLGWTKNGNPAGSVGASSQLEAIEVRVLPKNSTLLSPQTALFNPSNQQMPEDYSLTYASQVSYVGWTPTVLQNTVTGFIGQSRSIEALRFGFARSFEGDLSLACSVYVQGQGWLENIGAGGTCGTTGQTKSLDSIRLTLTGSAADKYELQYRVHLAWLGWQNWAKDGTAVGTINANQPIEAVNVRLIKK